LSIKIIEVKLISASVVFGSIYVFPAKAGISGSNAQGPETSSGRGFLLACAMKCAKTPDEIGAIDSDDIAFGKQL
jgi:hypothetical protein